MNIIENCQALGQAIKESPALVAYFAAKEAYDKEAHLQSLMFEYEAQRKILGSVFAREEETDPALITSIRDRIQALAGEIVALPTYREFEDSKKAVNALMEQVNAEISAAVFGVRPSSCTHDCSTCSGCASHSDEDED